MASKALVLFFLLACGAGCDGSDPSADTARSSERANEETQGGSTVDARGSLGLWQPAAPPDAPVHVRQVRETYGAAAQVAGFYFERVIVGAIEFDWHPEHVVVGDVTADRRPDVVMSMSITGASVVRGGGSSGTVLIRIYAQMPDGALAAPVEFRIKRAVNWGHALELADLDSNGVPEVALADDTGLTIISQTGGEFVTRWHPSSGRYGALASIDANGDGRMDVFAQGVEYGSRVFLGDGRGGISGVEQVDTDSTSRVSAEVSDFTADGLPDLVVSQSGGYSVRIYPLLRGSGLQRQPIQVDVRGVLQTLGTYGTTVGDIDRDGRPDLVITDWGNSGTPQPRGVRVVYRGAGNDFARSVLLETPGAYTSPSAVGVADLDGNGYPDIVSMFDSSDRMGYFLQGPSGFPPVVFQNTDDNPWTNNHYGENSYAIADVNSDGCRDVVLAEVSSSLRIFYGRNCQVAIPQMGTNLPPLRQ